MTFSSQPKRPCAPALRLLPGLAAHLARGFVPRVLSFELADLGRPVCLGRIPSPLPVCVVHGARKTTHLSFYDGSRP
jgi:hypothetical protein